MKRITLYIILLATLSSCSTYYYSILETPSLDTECIDNGDFLYENDSLWIAYNFGGENNPVRITVYNKLSTPLYVDWTKSALIINNVSEPYANNDNRFYGGSVGETVQTHHNRTVSYNEFGGILEESEGVSYVIPQTMVSKQFMNIFADYRKIKDTEYEKILLPNKRNEQKEVKKINYNLNNTPLKFKSYLTYYYNPNKLLSHQSEFYMAGLLKTSAISPDNLPFNMTDKGNISHIIHTNNTGWYIAGGIAVTAGLIISISVDSHTIESSSWDY